MTDRGTGCVTEGVCGKNADMESLQKILLYGLKGMAAYKHHARRLGAVDTDVDADGDVPSVPTTRAPVEAGGLVTAGVARGAD